MVGMPNGPVGVEVDLGKSLFVPICALKSPPIIGIISSVHSFSIGSQRIFTLDANMDLS